jgi:cysteinyl-tRNA synthetase
MPPRRQGRERRPGLTGPFRDLRDWRGPVPASHACLMRWQEQALYPRLPGGPREDILVLGGTALPLVGRARVYSCGITPYDVTHLGHAAAFVWVDTLSRVLHADGVDVIVCRNVTDVDDVLTAAAERAGEPYDEFAAVQQFYFEQDMASLRVGVPAIQPRAHAHIGQVIALAAGLLARDAAYERAGSVYFRGGAAARAAMPDEERALRLAAEYGDEPGDPRKDDPLDVAIWRASDSGQPAWASPWGAGRPGWHAECAAIALHAFGSSVDVQAGGGDLRFPHHVYQAALAEALTGVTPFARARLAAGMVRVAGQKMAKSAGNLVLVSDLLAKYPAAAVRLLILDRPWAEDWDYEQAGLDAAAARLDRLHAAAGRPGAGSGEAAAARIRAALRADLDVPAALAVAEEVGGQAARALSALLGLW